MLDAGSFPWFDADNAASTASVAWHAPVPFEVALLAPLAPDFTAITVYANHGRWIVECPDCRGAQLACPGDRRFMCNECGNADVGGMWRPVIWPDEPSQIAELLDAREVPELQNWTSLETVADLESENQLLVFLAEGGDPVELAAAVAAEGDAS